MYCGIYLGSERSSALEDYDWDLTTELWSWMRRTPGSTLCMLLGYIFGWPIKGNSLLSLFSLCSLDCNNKNFNKKYLSSRFSTNNREINMSPGENSDIWAYSHLVLLSPDWIGKKNRLIFITFSYSSYNDFSLRLSGKQIKPEWFHTWLKPDLSLIVDGSSKVLWDPSGSYLSHFCAFSTPLFTTSFYISLKVGGVNQLIK